MVNNEGGIKINKRKATLQFITAMLIVGLVVFYTILSESKSEVTSISKAKISFGTSYTIGKYSPYIIGGIILLITIYRNVVISIYEDIREKLKR